MKNQLYILIVLTVFFAGIIHVLTKNLLLRPVDGNITSDFGYRTHPISGEYSFHNGIDIKASIGTPIKAPFSGTVVSVFYNQTGGNQIILERNDGFRSGFAHLSETFVKKGQKVSLGQIIGKVGNTGNSTGSHLHFILKSKYGKYLDPKKLLV